jgi:hypothetical protein
MAALMRSRWCLETFPWLNGLSFRRARRPAGCETRRALVGLTAATPASSIMKVSRR